MILLLLALACGDPELDPVRVQLDDFAAARAAYDRGDYAAAAQGFGAVAAAMPGSPTPASWQALALAQGGDLPGAIALLTDALKRFPEDVTLRYNRAALRARSGALAGAAEDLRSLYDRGLVDPFAVGEDPDFLALATHPDYAALAPKMGVVAVLGETPPSALLGEELRVELQLLGPEGQPIELRPVGAAPVAWRLVRVVEDEGAAQGRVRGRRLELAFRALTPGAAPLGPWQARAVEAFAEIGPRAVEIVDLPARPRSERVAPGPLPVPSAWAAGRAVPSLAPVEGRPLLITPVEAEVTAPGGPDELRMELRRQGQPALALRWLSADAQGAVVVRVGGETLLDATLPLPVPAPVPTPVPAP